MKWYGNDTEPKRCSCFIFQMHRKFAYGKFELELKICLNKNLIQQISENEIPLPATLLNNDECEI